MSIIKRIEAKLKSYMIELSIPYKHIIGQRNFIIMYHGVISTNDNLYNSRHAYVKDFEQQIKYLTKYCNILSVEDYFKGKFKKGVCNIALTFDDGFRNNLEYAAPILKKYNAPASFYITGLASTEHQYIWADFFQIAANKRQEPFKIGDDKFIRKDNGFFMEKGGISLMNYIKEFKPHYEQKIEIYQALKKEFDSLAEEKKPVWQLMNKEDLVILTKDFPNITIGSHGFLHNNLGNIDANKAEKELVESKKYLENIIQKEVNEVGYPDGSYSRSLVDFADKIGFKYQLAATPKFKFDEDKCDNRLRARNGVYQIGSWGSQINFRLV